MVYLIEKATGYHINLLGYSLADLRFTAIEHKKGIIQAYRKKRTLFDKKKILSFLQWYEQAEVSVGGGDIS